MVHRGEILHVEEERQSRTLMSEAIMDNSKCPSTTEFLYSDVLKLTLLGNYCEYSEMKRTNQTGGLR